MMQLSHTLYDINLNRSNSDCTTRKTDVSPFVRMSVERTSMRRKKVSADSENFNNVFYLADCFKKKRKEREREKKGETTNRTEQKFLKEKCTRVLSRKMLYV